MKRLFVCCLFLAWTGTMFAQTKNPVTDVVKDSLARRQKATIAAIDEMPADKFGYKPTPDQMTFAHLATHIVEANNYFCATAAGVPALTVTAVVGTAQVAAVGAPEHVKVTLAFWFALICRL